MTVRQDAVAWVGFGVAVVGIVWLAPLMVDQMTFFGDRDQIADAAAARAFMPLPGLLIAAGAARLGLRLGMLIGGLVALPIVAIALAWMAPDTLYQLLAYGLTGPISVGALLAACLSPDRAATRLVAIAAIAVILGGAVIATPFLSLIAGGILATWWSLSNPGRLSRSSAPTRHTNT
jgi:hypothetical protein